MLQNMYSGQIQTKQATLTFPPEPIDPRPREVRDVEAGILKILDQCRNEIRVTHPDNEWVFKVRNLTFTYSKDYITCLVGDKKVHMRIPSGFVGLKQKLHDAKTEYINEVQYKNLLEVAALLDEDNNSGT